MPDELDSSPDEDDEKSHFAAVGLVASNWAYFELTVDDWCLRVADLPSSAASCLTAQISGSARKFDAFVALARLFGIGSATVQELERLGKDLSGVAEQRNRAVHDPWIVSRGKMGHRLEVTARRVLRKKPISVKTETLFQLTDNIERLNSRFVELATRIYDETAKAREEAPRQYSL